MNDELKQLDVKAEKAKQDALKTVNQADSWIERHPTLVLVIALTAFIVMIALIAKHT